MYVYDEGVRRSGEDWDTLLKKGVYYYNESLAGLWQGMSYLILLILDWFTEYYDNIQYCIIMSMIVSMYVIW